MVQIGLLIAKAFWGPLQPFISAFYSSLFIPLYFKRAILGADPSCGPLPLTDEIKSAITDPKWGKHRHIQANGLRFHVVEKGSADKPLVLFLHGFPEFWYSWRHLLLDLSASGSIHAVAVDLRGYGETDKPDGVLNYTVELLCSDVAALITALGHSKAVVVGHDWGANIAWNFAHLYPDMVEGVVPMNCPHPVKFVENARWTQFFKSWYIYLFQCPAIPEIMMSEGGWKFMDGGMVDKPMGVVDRKYFTDTDLAIMKYAISQPKVATCGINYYRNLFRRRKPELVKALQVPIKAPTLFLWGENDGALGMELTVNTDTCVDKLKLVVLPDCSHWIQQDRPKEVVKIMAEFLQTIGINVKVNAK